MPENGKFPAHMLSPTVAGGVLTDAAAASVGRMAVAFYNHFGYPLIATDTYRTYQQQVEVREEKGVWAAKPGTSRHGLGVAVDWKSNINNDKSAEHRWMEQNGPKYGWFNPFWAVDNDPDNGQYEPWHWEYIEALDRMKSAPGVVFPPRGMVGFGQYDSDAVGLVQGMLKDLGYPVTVDKDFGMGTAIPLLSFQKKHNLTQDSIAGPATISKLKNAVKAKEDNEMPTSEEIAKAVWDHKAKVPSNLRKYLGETATMRAITTAIAFRVQLGVTSDEEIIAALKEIDTPIDQEV